jgi:hypothetical protein
MLVLLFLDEGSDVFLEVPEADEGAVPSFALLEDIGVFEVVFELGSALDTCVADLADLDGVELVPLALVELVVEVDDELCMNEVEKGVPDVAVVLSNREGTL